MTQLNFGIITAASIVERFIRGVQATTGTKVLAIGASTLEKAQKVATQCNIERAYGSYLEVFEDKDIDIVYIASINDKHYEHIMMALDHGKHVLCEKPMLLLPEQVEEVFRIAEEKRLFVMEAQKSVFLPTTRYLKQKVLDNDFGPLLHIHMSASYANRHPKGHWMHQPQQGGALFGSGSYVIEYLLHLLDMPKFTYVSQAVLSSTHAIDDVVILFNFNDGLLASTHVSTLVDTDDTARFYFRDGYITIKNFWKSQSLTIVYHDDREDETLTFPHDYEMMYEVMHVRDCINNNQIVSDVMTPQLIYRCVSLLQEIYQKHKI